MSKKADVKFSWTKSPSANVVSQVFKAVSSGVVLSEGPVGLDVEAVQIRGLKAGDFIDWSVTTTNKFGVSAVAVSEYTVPDFGVEPATNLAAELVEVYDEE